MKLNRGPCRSPDNIVIAIVAKVVILKLALTICLYGEDDTELIPHIIWVPAG